MAKSNTCNKWPDVPMFDQLIASDQDVLGTPAESYPWQKGDPILAPRRWYLLSGSSKKWWIFVVVVYRLEMILYGLFIPTYSNSDDFGWSSCEDFTKGTRRFWSLPISDPTDRQLDSIILQLWVWENK